jgi:alginate O-acetyltransferase complex protein AlgI
VRTVRAGRWGRSAQRTLQEDSQPAWQVHPSTASRPAPHHRYQPAPRPEPETPTEHTPGLFPGEPAACRRDVREFLPVLAHLGLLLAVFKVFNIEGRAFQLLVAMSLAALPVHYLLAYRWKRPFFIAVSVVALFWIFGGVTAGCVLALAALLIGTCYLPIAWYARAGLVAAIAVALALARPETNAAIVPDNVWPVLATMFMFRIILYLYELKHAKKPEPLLDTLGYFFLLPNYCFLHFPVVDYRTLQRGYFASPIATIQRRGLQMMFRGTVHLLLYRLIYHELLIPAEEVSSPASLAGFLICNYLLYLHVSGQFHMACGMLHLFGFQLPDTHHHYLLASSFTDYWRRINIYWKDFMVRVFFNPVAFRLKRWPQPIALALATVVVFTATWSLHAYQSFWLRGTWGFSVHDALFWGILGLLVLVNVQIDARRPRNRDPRALPASPRAFAIRAGKVAATFTTIAVLWSLWSSPSVGAWVDMMRRGLRV